jgi:hypothetical protein
MFTVSQKPFVDNKPCKCSRKFDTFTENRTEYGQFRGREHTSEHKEHYCSLSEHLAFSRYPIFLSIEEAIVAISNSG